MGRETKWHMEKKRKNKAKYSLVSMTTLSGPTKLPELGLGVPCECEDADPLRFLYPSSPPCSTPWEPPIPKGAKNVSGASLAAASVDSRSTAVAMLTPMSPGSFFTSSPLLVNVRGWAFTPSPEPSAGAAAVAAASVG